MDFFSVTLVPPYCTFVTVFINWKRFWYFQISLDGFTNILFLISNSFAWIYVWLCLLWDQYEIHLFNQNDGPYSKVSWIKELIFRFNEFSMKNAKTFFLLPIIEFRIKNIILILLSYTYLTYTISWLKSEIHVSSTCMAKFLTSELEHFFLHMWNSFLIWRKKLRLLNRLAYKSL